jgi:uncharacterized protein (DUF2249 family)
MGGTRTVDGRNLPAPEPMERVLEALDTLGADERLRFLIHREPYPLYDILRRHGYAYESAMQDDGSFVVLIWRAGKATARREK